MFEGNFGFWNVEWLDGVKMCYGGLISGVFEDFDVINLVVDVEDDGVVVFVFYDGELILSFDLWDIFDVWWD